MMSFNFIQLDTKHQILGLFFQEYVFHESDYRENKDNKVINFSNCLCPEMTCGISGVDTSYLLLIQVSNSCSLRFSQASPLLWSWPHIPPSSSSEVNHHHFVPFIPLGDTQLTVFTYHTVAMCIIPFGSHHLDS